MSKLLELQQAHRKFIAQLRAAGRRILCFKAPCCGAKLEAMAALEGETWNTGATCHECGAAYWRETTDQQITGYTSHNGKAIF